VSSFPAQDHWGGTPSLGARPQNLWLARGSADFFCLRARRYLHHGLPRSDTWPRTLTTPLHAITLHSHLLPHHTPASHSHLSFGYKLTLTVRTTGLAPNVAKNWATANTLTPWQSIQRNLVVPLSSPHQKSFVCGACIDTTQVGVSLVSLFDPLFKRSGLHCFDTCLTWYLRHIKIWWQHLVPIYRTTSRVCFVKPMMIMRQYFPRYDPYQLHARGLGLCLC